ncbi:MAG: response regulator [Acidobacteria bacterium]|nr:response regulator [Acidobacteriota bacterium]
MSPKLLVADDSVTIQRVIELTFADEDVQVTSVSDGQQAIQRIEAERPDIVLADVGMPERDGYEVAAYVKNAPHLAHTPVLLLTGAFEPVDEAKARAVKCDGVLAKPFEPQVVISRVRELLANRRPPLVEAPRPAPREATPPSGVRERDVPVSAAPRFEDQSAGSESLDDYFDRLDAAFANLGPAPRATGTAEEPRHETPPPPPASRDRVAPTRDYSEPELRPERPRTERPAPEPPQLSRPVPPAPAPAARPQGVPGHLADAFTALLAAEQGQASPDRPSPRSATAGAVVTDEFVDEITRRVIARLTDDLVRDIVSDTVLHVADRLVRQEIERIKQKIQ